MARTNRRYASARVKANNPMSHPESLEKMKATLAAIGHHPRQRGGNGASPTAPQSILASLLGWPMEVVVPTGGKYQPHHYKLDIANAAMKVAVEVDGRSHGARARQAADRRKEEWLRGAGWCVLRFTNQEVLAQADRCVQTVLSTTSKWMGRTPT